MRAANGANVTVTFALATIPMVGFVGAAVDYSHANSVKAAMQAAADFDRADAVEDRRDADAPRRFRPRPPTTSRRCSPAPEATGVTVNATYNANTGSGSQVIVTASSNVKANFMGLMGVSTMKVGVDSQVKWGNTKMRVALVLDTTGSMADDGKMTALKTATKSLLTQLKTAAANERRRLRVDHSVQQGRQRRHEQLQRDLDRLDRLGRRQRRRRQHTSDLHQATA